MIEGLSRFARRASATSNAYVRGRQGTRAKAPKVFGPIEASNADPAALANEIQERLDALDPSDGKVYVEVVTHGETSAEAGETLVVDLSDTPGPSPATHADGLVGRAMDALLRSNEQLTEAAATALAQAGTMLDARANAAEQRDAAIEDAWRERVKNARGESKADGEEKPAAAMDPRHARMLDLGIGIILSKLTGQPLQLPGPGAPAAPPAGGADSKTDTTAEAPRATEAEAAEYLDRAIEIMLACAQDYPALVTAARVQRLAPLLGLAMGAQ